MGNKLASKKSTKNSKKTNTSVNSTVEVKGYAGPPNSFIVKSKYKYTATGDTDISFDEKEIMYVIEQYDENWYFVIKQKDNTRGMIPSNYVSKQDGSPQSVEAWREIQRWESEKLLMRVGLQRGTYIVRPSRQEKSFAISVRDFDEENKICNVKNFQIKITEDEKGNFKGYSVNQRRFPDMITLILYYEKNGIGGSLIPLTTPMPDDYQPPIHFKDIEINRENLEIISQIGEGCFGTVYKAKWGKGYEVAAKMMKSTKEEREKFLSEARIMHKLRHRKIVELLGVCTKPEKMPMIIVVEFMENGSLKEYLKSEKGKKINLYQMLHMIAEISEGMAYLERQNVVHKDLRADNILVAADLSVKVADFGLTEFLDENSENQEKRSIKFPYKWTAPEAAKTRTFTSKSDIWSYGVVMYEILTWAHPPYPGIPPKEVIDKVSAGYRMPNPEKIIPNVWCPNEVYQIMLCCWEGNPENRPSFSELQEKIDHLIESNGTYYSQSVA